AVVADRLRPTVLLGDHPGLDLLLIRLVQIAEDVRRLRRIGGLSRTLHHQEAARDQPVTQEPRSNEYRHRPLLVSVQRLIQEGGDLRESPQGGPARAHLSGNGEPRRPRPWLSAGRWRRSGATPGRAARCAASRARAYGMRGRRPVGEWPARRGGSRRRPPGAAAA